MSEVVRDWLTALLLNLVRDYNSLADAEDVRSEVDQIMVKFFGITPEGKVTAAMSQYTAEDRERWAAEIREAKRTMTKAEFADWLYRRVNTVGTPKEVQQT